MVDAHETAIGRGSVRDAFKSAMSTFPSGVTIVTTTDEHGESWGFTANSFCSLSMDPPLVLVCLARTATCFETFMKSEGWVVNIISERAHDLARTFATRGADKFAGGHFDAGPTGHPTLRDAPVSLHCDAWNRYDGGDHVIIVGRVTDVDLTDAVPSIYFRRDFHRLPNHS
jgi:flavin reductase ActVB